MIILGINAYHGDSSACLVSEGNLLCAIEEERIRRIKHWAGLPTESIKWCLDYTGIDIQDVNCIALSKNPSAHLHKKVLRVLRKTPSLGFLKDRLQNVARVKDMRSSIADTLGVDKREVRAKIQNVEHHRAHLASTFLVSPFNQAACISVDGFGDFLSVMRGVGEGNEIRIMDQVEYPHSLGIFYTAFTQFLGFPRYGDEYKVMGLSAYGDSSYMDEMREVVNLTDEGLFELDTSFFLHAKEGVDMVWEGGQPSLGTLFSDRMVDLFGEPREKEEEISKRHRDISASTQAMYEEVFFHMLNDLREKSGTDKITLAGGCVQNSLANGKIYERTPFKHIYIPPAAYDGGTAVGAAFWVWNVLLRKGRGFQMTSPFLGPEFSDDNLESVLRKEKVRFLKLEETELLAKTAKDIAEGKVVGWFQGRTEWGPRALGNRSILVDPRKKEMKDILNSRIKMREWFRPFAPSVLEDFTSEWFQESSSVPFMEKVYRIRPEKRELIKAVVHEDGTGRLQTVSRKMNPKYYNLIEEFYKITDVPVVLNTSFNENEPIVNTPEQALDCFLRTDMDVLVMENYYVE